MGSCAVSQIDAGKKKTTIIQNINVLYKVREKGSHLS